MRARPAAFWASRRQGQWGRGLLSLAIAGLLCPFIVRGQSIQSNPIVIENQQPGSAGWDFTGSIGSDAVGQIKGYASATSVNKGESITFFVTVNPAQSYTIDIYRVGWYQGLGGRLMQHVGPLDGVPQATCPMDAVTGMIECQWDPSYTLNTQSSWTSGVYLAVLTNAQSFQNYIIFVVRDDGRPSAILYQQPVTTYQAYNNYPDDQLTGKSLYDFNSFGVQMASTGYKSAAKVSFDRPYGDSGIDGGFLSDYGEINFIRWMERMGYDVTYSTDVDTHANGSALLNHRAFLSVGHDEYWSKEMYDAATGARDAGVNLGFFGANAVYWQIRFEASSSNAANRVVVCYKNATLDPIADPSLKTVNWRDPSINRPEQALIGVQYNQLSYPPMNGGFFPSLAVTNSTNWVYAGTGFRDGDAAIGTIGYESDRYDDAYPAPVSVGGTFTMLSQSPWGSGPADYANTSIYQAPSGAWVYATGSMSYNWALDDYGHGYNLVNTCIQRATANVLDRFAGTSSPPGPTACTVTPATGSGAGGTAITITGANFTDGTTVALDGIPATSVTVNGNTIVATTPAHPNGTADVMVATPDGQTATMVRAFTYVGAPPTVSGVALSSGATSGGTSITITGSAFGPGATLTMGGNAATAVTVVSDTTISAMTPAHDAGAVDVTVTNVDGQSGTLASGFTFTDAAPSPAISSVTPASGSMAGGTAITITGSNFGASVAVTVGGVAAIGVTVISATIITATTPASAAGAVDVTVTNPDAQLSTLPNSFTYVADGP